MSLGVALNNARASLMTTAKQIAISGNNIRGADDPNYTRKIAEQVTHESGSASILTIRRAADPNLQQRVLTATALTGGQQSLLDGLNHLQQTIGDTNSGTSPAALIGKLSDALAAQANAASDPNLAQETISVARTVANTLNDASALISSVRTDADAAMAASVDRSTALLQQIEALNAKITNGQFAGQDITNELDQRDAAIDALSQEMGIKVVHRTGGDLAIYTDSGVPLFDKTARVISFQQSSVMASGVAGNAVFIDGVPVTGPNATMRLSTGKLAGLAALRDDVAPTFQVQLDEIARGLIEAMAEADQSGGGGPNLTGLFTHAGGPGLPPPGVHVAGLAASIMLNPAVDPSVGGNAAAVRDGGINGPGYVYNVTGSASFSDRLEQLTDALSQARSFDAASGLPGGVGVGEFGTSSVAWLEDLRQSTSGTFNYHNTVLARVSEALSNASGVNIDDEYAKQLQLEQSYAASSKLLAIIDEMFDALMRAVR